MPVSRAGAPIREHAHSRFPRDWLWLAPNQDNINVQGKGEKGLNVILGSDSAGPVRAQGCGEEGQERSAEEHLAGRCHILAPL